MTNADQRAKLIEAMAVCMPGYSRVRREGLAVAALTAIAEQGYAVVPKEASFPPLARTLDATVFYNGAIADADVARSKPVGCA